MFASSTICQRHEHFPSLPWWCHSTRRHVRLVKPGSDTVTSVEENLPRIGHNLAAVIPRLYNLSHRVHARYCDIVCCDSAENDNTSEFRILKALVGCLADEYNVRLRHYESQGQWRIIG